MDCSPGQRLVLVLFLAGTLAAACTTGSGTSDESAERDSPSEQEGERPAEAKGDAPESASSIAPELTERLPESPVSDCTSLAGDSEPAEEHLDLSSLKPFRATGVVATVDGDPISAEQFNRRAAATFSGRKTAGMPQRMAESLKMKTLNSVVEAILTDRTLENHSATASPAELRDELESFQDRFPSRRAFRSFLEMRALTPGELLSDLCRDLRLRSMLADTYDIDIDDERIRAYYEQHSDRYDRPEQVRASHILVKLPPDASDAEESKAEARAEKLADQARSGEVEFADLAKEHSEGPSAREGGDLGYFARDRMVEDFAEAAFDAEPGEIVGPVRTKFGFHVIHVRDRRPADTRDLEEVRDDIRDRLERKEYRNALEEFKSELRRRHDIELHADRIEVTTERGAEKPRTESEDDGRSKDRNSKELKRKIKKMEQNMPDSD